MTILDKMYMQGGNARLLPIDRNDPTLVLYLPLWYPHGDMTGSTIYSYDTNRHTCTVTGATWGLQGRTFDGSDDRILVAYNSAFNFAAGDFTIPFWFYRNSNAADTDIISSRPTSTAVSGWLLIFGANSGIVNALFSYNGTTWGLTSGNWQTIPNITWSHVALRRSGAEISIWLNGVKHATTLNIGANSLYNSSYGIVFGAAGNGLRACKSSFGEVLIYSRALTAAEVMRNYQLTKWRYI